MEADSDSDISILGESSRVKQKGKGKLVSKSDKGKGKQKDTVSAKSDIRHYISHNLTASIHMGSFIYTLLGRCAGR